MSTSKVKAIREKYGLSLKTAVEVFESGMLDKLEKERDDDMVKKVIAATLAHDRVGRSYVMPVTEDDDEALVEDILNALDEENNKELELLRSLREKK